MAGVLRPLPFAMALNGLLGLLYAGAALSSARRARRDGDAALGWWLFSIAAMTMVLGRILLLWAGASTGSASEGQEPGLIVTSIANPLLCVTLFVWPGAPRSLGVRGRLLLDGIVVGGSFFFAVWTLGLGTAVHSIASSPRVFAATLSSIVLAVAAIAVCALLVIRDPPRLRGPLGWLMLCLTTSIVADVVAATLSLHGGFYYWGHTVDSLQLFPAAALLGSTLSRRPVATRLWTDGDVATAAPGFAPYVPVFLALIAAAYRRSTPSARFDDVQATTAAVVITALVLRQYLALHDLRELSRTLEDRVQTRTRALQESQAALVRSQRLDAVGRMAASLAHDFNNLLTIIGAAVEYGRMRPDENARDVAFGEIDAASRRGTELVRQLLAFARRQPRKPRIVDVTASVRDIEPLLRRLLGPAHRLVLEDHGSPLHVEADPAQLEQVLVNLVTNARDAMASGGTVTIRTTTTLMEPESGTAESVRGVGIVVRDTGPGIPKEVMAHLFEPFFTTKGAQGSGLGLSSCYGIVTAAGGRIHVETELGKGTTFRVLFPRADAPDSRDVPSASEAV